MLGPPGAGKGTQARLLGEKFEACQVSTGDILRKAVADQSPLGKEAFDYIKRGALVPDSVIVNLVAERLKEKDCQQGFILDGFPRTIPQAQGLEEILRKMGLGLQSVLLVQVPDAVIVERLAGRRTCKSCGALYHLNFNPSTKESTCDRCGGELLQRDDDREETISARLKVYDNQTAPLVDYYRQRGILREIDGVGKVEDIRNRMIKALEGPET
ncbi:MAG TPA: adenylate kinase [Terriglobia bacterium]|nr:adenylate kinase [Terriglobia bacterium]